MEPRNTVHLIKEPEAVPSPGLACEHCESPLTSPDPTPASLGLCPACSAVEGIVSLYVRRHGWSPQREARIREYARRARLLLPLFDIDD